MRVTIHNIYVNLMIVNNRKDGAVPYVSSKEFISTINKTMLI